ncbi:MAG: acetyl-CoA synthetase, partial [Bacteroidales bacterium]|nr:acetyl-CoA synthetase [Bacteroidales bacterium]
MIEKYLKKTKFTDYEDFKANYELIVPENFNFAYDVVDEWAKTNPDKKALLWTNDQGDVREYTFSDMKRETDKTASYFQSIGIKKGDMVMA